MMMMIIIIISSPFFFTKFLSLEFQFHDSISLKCKPTHIFAINTTETQSAKWSWDTHSSQAQEIENKTCRYMSSERLFFLITQTRYHYNKKAVL
jgi:hypothetical protein